MSTILTCPITKKRAHREYRHHMITTLFSKLIWFLTFVCNKPMCASNFYLQ
jgi:hypothetical protein